MGQAKLTPTQPPVATLAPAFQPETTPFPAETAGWKTYEYPDLKFEIKLPLGWALRGRTQEQPYWGDKKSKLSLLWERLVFGKNQMRKVPSQLLLLI